MGRNHKERQPQPSFPALLCFFLSYKETALEQMLGTVVKMLIVGPSSSYTYQDPYGFQFVSQLNYLGLLVVNIRALLEVKLSITQVLATHMGGLD